jgi:hypothetical protein
MNRKSVRPWDAEDLQRRLCHALDIAKRTVDRLASDGYADPEEPSARIRAEKVISETALLLLAASTAAAGHEVRRRIHSVATILQKHARSNRMLLGICLEPALALDYAAAHLCLSRLGYPDANFDALLREALEAQSSGGRERVPHRALEQAWLMKGSSEPSADRQHIWNGVRESVLNRPMDLLNGSRDDLYAFTHSLMYVSDFNISPRRLPRNRSVIRAEAEAALARCLDEQDYDLAGEILLAWPLTSATSWSAVAAFGFRVLASVDDQAGFLPTASTRIQRLAELEGQDRESYLLATAYHTIYVMGLLCATALQPGRTPPAYIPTTAAMPGSAERILSLLQPGDHAAHWTEEFTKLSSLERDALAPMLLDIGLRRSVERRDFGAVAGLLAAGDALGLTDRPQASQAAELLHRLACFSEMCRIAQTA